MSSVLNDKTIKSLFEKGVKLVDPFIDEALQPASIDLRLGNSHYKYKLEQYILGDAVSEDLVVKEEFQELTLKDNKCAHLGIKEKISIPDNVIGIVLPRSSITRLGVLIAPVYINPGYSGYIPITITNQSGMAITLKPDYRVVQLILWFLNEQPDKDYKSIEDSKYFDEHVDYSKLHLDKEIASMVDEIIKEESPYLYKKMTEN